MWGLQEPKLLNTGILCMDFRICSQFDLIVIYDRFKVTMHLQGVPFGKIRMYTSFNTTLTNNISEESLKYEIYDNNTI